MQVDLPGRPPGHDAGLAERQQQLDRLERVSLQVAVRAQEGVGRSTLPRGLDEQVGVVGQHRAEQHGEKSERREGGPRSSPHESLHEERQAQELGEERREVDVVEAGHHGDRRRGPEAARSRPDPVLFEGPGDDEDGERDRPVEGEREVGERAVKEERRQREGTGADEGPLGSRSETTAHGLEGERRKHRREQDEQVGGGKEPDGAREAAGEGVLQLVLPQEVVPARAEGRAELGDFHPAERRQVPVVRGLQRGERVPGVGAGVDRHAPGLEARAPDDGAPQPGDESRERESGERVLSHGPLPGLPGRLASISR